MPEPNYPVAKVDDNFEEIIDDKYKRDYEQADRIYKFEMEKFKKQRWQEYLNILTKESLLLDEAEIYILRDKLLVAMEFYGEDLNELTNFIFDPHPAEDIEVAEIFLKAKFDGFDEYLEAANDLLDIGAYLEKWSIANILDYDSWNKEEKKEIKNEIERFVHNYGLLGILNIVFIFGLEEYYDSIGNNFDELYVNTLFMDISFDVSIKNNSDGKEVFSKQRVKAQEYAKIFFPDVTPDLFEGYQLQDGKFWTTYSEPVYMFLLSIKLFYEDYKKVQMACIGRIDSPAESITGTLTKTEFVFDKEREIYRLQYTFNSLVELLMFYSKKQLVLGNEAIIICKECGHPFIKNPRRKPEYCSDKCSSRYRQRDFQSNKCQKANVNKN